MKPLSRCAAFAALFLVSSGALAQDVPVELQPATETARYLFDTLLLLLGGLAAAAIAAGLAMREAGLAGAKNAGIVCIKTIGAYATAMIAAWLLGYNLLHGVEKGGLLGVFDIWRLDDDAVGAGHAGAAFWFFEMASVAIAVFIVSGALSERVKLWAFLIFAALFAGLVVPIAASWVWGGGYLDANWGFVDFGGAALLHVAGGAAALAGALVLGPRLGKYDGKTAHATPGSNLPLAGLGTFIVWFCWFGALAARRLTFGSAEDAAAIAKIFVNVGVGAAAAVLAAMLLTQIVYKKIDAAVALSAVIGGLVSMSADPGTPATWQAALIGAFGGVIVAVSPPMLDRLHIDDVVGAIPAHLFCGLWATLIVPWANEEASFLSQLVGAGMVGAFVFIVSFLLFILLKYTIGLRAAPTEEEFGLDRALLGVDAYADFEKR